MPITTTTSAPAAVPARRGRAEPPPPPGPRAPAPRAGGARGDTPEGAIHRGARLGVESHAGGGRGRAGGLGTPCSRDRDHRRGEREQPRERGFDRARTEGAGHGGELLVAAEPGGALRPAEW